MEYLLHVFTLVREAYLLDAWTNIALWVPYLFLYGCQLSGKANIVHVFVWIQLQGTLAVGYNPNITAETRKKTDPNMTLSSILFLYFLSIFTSLKKPHFLGAAQYSLRIIKLS